MLFLLSQNIPVDQDKLAEIFKRYKNEIFLIAYGILKDYYEAEDVLQSVIIKLSKHLDLINDVGAHKTRAFVISMTRHYSYDQFNRRKKLELVPDFNDDNISYCNDSTSFDGHHDEQVFIEIAHHLKREYSEMLALKYYHGLKIPEIASLLGITENNASTRLNRAHAAVKRFLSERKSL